MGYIASHLMDLIGNTPLLSLNNYKSKVGYDAEIIVKLEFLIQQVALKIELRTA